VRDTPPRVLQPDLFSFQGHVGARATDHDSSHEAMDELERSGAAAIQRGRVLGFVRSWPGRTSLQMADLAGVDRHMVARRLPELVKEGLIRRDKPIGKMIVWWPL
jgi:DNA-binding MarR family transcriptional regulator